MHEITAYAVGAEGITVTCACGWSSGLITTGLDAAEIAGDQHLIAADQ